jgi:hypothetical protein
MQNRKSNKTKTNCGIGKKRRISFWQCGDCSSDSLSLASANFAWDSQQKKLRDGREREREREGACVSAAANQRPPTKGKRKDSRLTAELALSYCAIPRRDLGHPTSLYEHLARCDHARCNELRDFRRPDDWSLLLSFFWHFFFLSNNCPTARVRCIGRY